MDVTSLGHSCLLVEYADTRVLLDPGTFSSGFESLTHLDAILVTHEHPDHLDPARFAALVAANPGAQVWAEPGVAAALADGSSAAAGGASIAARALRPGESVSLGAVTVEGAGGRHAVIYRALPEVGNVGVLLRAEGEPTLFHPGDSLDAVPAGVDVLAVPVSAPWCAVKETVDFVRAVGAPRAIPIHDRVVSAQGRPIYLKHIEGFGGSEVVEIADRGAVTL